jgi:hypothetical protein
VAPVRVGFLADYIEGEDRIDPVVLRALRLTFDEYYDAGVLERPVDRHGPGHDGRVHHVGAVTWPVSVYSVIPVVDVERLASPQAEVVPARTLLRAVSSEL